MHTSPFRDTVDISEPYMVGFASLYPPQGRLPRGTGGAPVGASV